MAHQRQSDTAPLIAIDDEEGHLGSSGLCHDETCSTSDDAPPPFFQGRNQSNMIAEVGIQEVGDLFFRKALLGREQTPVEGLRAALTHGLEELSPIAWLKGSYDYGRAAVHHLRCLVVRWFQDTISDW